MPSYKQAAWRMLKLGMKRSGVTPTIAVLRLVIGEADAWGQAHVHDPAAQSLRRPSRCSLLRRTVKAALPAHHNSFCGASSDG